MRLRTRFHWLIAIMIVVTTGVELAAIGILHETSFREDARRFSELAKSQARLMESIVRFDREHHPHDPGGARTATLSQILDSLDRYERFSDTGEFLIAEQRDDEIHFLFGHRQDEIIRPEPVPAGSGLADPMFLALSGRSGTIVGSDYHGEDVLAAYEHVAGLNLGLVAKIDLSEIREPFIEAAAVVAVIGFIGVALGVLLFMRITNPMITGMRDNIETLEAALKQVKLLSGLLPICAACKKVRDDGGYWSQIESYIRNHSEAEFSHGICPDCARELYPDLCTELDPDGE